MGDAERWRALLEADQRALWHPYAPAPAPYPPLPVIDAAGTRLRLADGRELIDGMSSWWCAIHGYGHPQLRAAMHEQVDRLAHVMFGGLTHEPAIELATRLVALAPGAMERVFFTDSGSVAVEVAIKLSLQHWIGRGQPRRRRLLTVRGGYHGDTFGAMSVCDPLAGMHRLFAGTVAEQVFAPQPPAGFDAQRDGRWERETGALFERHADELAAVIVEPIVQGAGGMHFYAPGCLRTLRELCDRHELLLVLDEIATGFGRSGTLFAAEHAAVTPDIVCVGKALTGGMISLAATLCSADVAAGVSAGEAGALMHGPTFMANPLACAAAIASLDLLLASDWRGEVTRIEAGLRAGLAAAADLPGVRDVRVLGAIGVVQLEREVDVAQASAAAIERGVWLRPFRDLIYAMPPYVCEDAEIDAICSAIVAAAGAGG